jgi:hypothetical protein
VNSNNFGIFSPTYITSRGFSSVKCQNSEGVLIMSRKS